MNKAKVKKIVDEAIKGELTEAKLKVLAEEMADLKAEIVRREKVYMHLEKYLNAQIELKKLNELY